MAKAFSPYECIDPPFSSLAARLFFAIRGGFKEHSQVFTWLFSSFFLVHPFPSCLDSIPSPFSLVHPLFPHGLQEYMRSPALTSFKGTQLETGNQSMESKSWKRPIGAWLTICVSRPSSDQSVRGERGPGPLLAPVPHQLQPHGILHVSTPHEAGAWPAVVLRWVSRDGRWWFDFQKHGPAVNASSRCGGRVNPLSLEFSSHNVTIGTGS